MNSLDLIRKILKEKYQVTSDINLDTNLMDELGFDSIIFMELAMEIKKEIKLKKEIPQEVINSWKTTKSITDSIAKL
jgi:acyl carrier protein